MRCSTPHIVRHQYLHVELNGTEEEGLNLQRSLPELCQHSLLPAVEAVLDRFSSLEEHLFLEQLDIDAGAMNLDLLEKDFAETVAHEIEKALRERVPPRVGIPDKHSPLPYPSLPMSVSPHLQWKSSRQHTIEAFLHYLAKGRFPWSYRLPPGETFEQAVRKLLVDHPTQDLSISGIQTVLMSPNARHRLVQQFSKGFLVDFLACIAPEILGAVQSVQEKVITEESGTEYPSLIDRLLEAALVELSAGTKTLTESKLATIVLHGQEPFPEAVVAKLRQVAKREKAVVASGTPVVEKQGRADNLLKLPEVEKNGRADSRGRSVDEAADSLSLVKDSLSIHPSEEAIYIDNAGLVLLHPFLSLFFEAVGVAREGKLLQPDRALGLLHFLGTGQVTAPEHELVLPKILCDLDPETPVGGDCVLSEDEKKEATALLEAVIRHWEALRNTTPEGLRGTFLLRSGKLSLRNDGEWLLQVESKSFDVLLDQLPWGFSMIQLPWMRRMLRVEWSDARS
jgi:hypothetical protein